MEDRHAQDMFHAILGDRGVVSVAGEDAKTFLQGLVTNDVFGLAPGKAAYAALLSAQGKILVDFLVTEAAAEKGGGLYLDCPRSLAGDLVKWLGFYRLRARITIADASARLGVGAAWGAGAQAWQPDDVVAAFRDPRDGGLGWRFIGAPGALAAASEPGAAERYEAHRIALGVPKGGADFAYGETFPHDANLDLIHGVDFKKGCFVGQEVVARVEHRGTARKRIVRVHFAGLPPAPGSEIVAGDVVIGTFGSAAAGTGLAMIRTDRAEEAVAGHVPLVADGVELALAPAG
jgi:folate-binding protein YgfZ